MRTNNIVTPCQKKCAAYFYILYISIFNKRARCGSVLRDAGVLLKLELFSTKIYVSTDSPFEINFSRNKIMHGKT